ncbi:hypothetical protein N9224_00575 [Akkermansiaceae bacterium]|nr:hypothetical protein [Akkermansiaceae bacterium]
MGTNDRIFKEALELSCQLGEVHLISPMIISYRASITLLATALLSNLHAEEPAKTNPPSVLVSRGPGKSWKPLPTRTLADLPYLPSDPAGSRFGGLAGTTHPSRPATGFFHTKKIDGRWWLIDPEGHLFTHRAVTSLKMLRTSGAKESLLEQFGTEEKWAANTSQLLLQHGFNGLGPWCDKDLFPSPEAPLVHTKIWNFMSAYGQKRGGTYQASGHTGYPQDCPFIFDPEFPAFCLRHSAQLADTKDDPWLLGHFTDNELPWRLSMLENYLKLPPGDPGYQTAAKWLTQCKGSNLKPSDITEKDREDFLAFAADTYFAAVTKAIRTHDPNHLILGARFHGRANKIPALFEAAGRHLDAISVNYYHAWTPDLELMKTWESKARKPILITEWYAKGEDSGLANTSGAGWLVKTQADRAAFYQNFTLSLLESRVCIGWHWFRYSDNDPLEKGRDPSNLDANKGIVTNRYQPYQNLLTPMKAINTRTHALIKHFDHLAKGSE